MNFFQLFVDDLPLFYLQPDFPPLVFLIQVFLMVSDQNLKVLAFMVLLRANFPSTPM